MSTTPAAKVLLTAVAEIARVVGDSTDAAIDAGTVCDPWTVRDVVAHCSGSLLRLIEDRSHQFTPEDNQVDVDERRAWAFDEVVDELVTTAAPAAERIAADGRLDGLGLGVWVHAGDVRDAVGIAEPYAGPGVDLAIGLLEERSRRLDFSLAARIGDRELTYGAGRTRGTLVTDPETFVRLAGGRHPDPDRFELAGAEPSELVLFS